MTNQVNSREIVLDMLMEIIEGEKYSHKVLQTTLQKYQYLDKVERAFISRLCTGTVKRYITLDYMINGFASLPVKKMKPLIRNLLRMSVYQILYMDQVPVFAICNEAVKLAKKRGFQKLSGFVNGILRNIDRNKATISFPNKESEPVRYLSVFYSVPEWIVQDMINQYGFLTAEKMFEASLKDKITTIRCNQKKNSPEQLKSLLEQEGVRVEDSIYLDYAFKISDYDYLDKLETFRQGRFTIQDVSSMLVCQVAGIEEKDFVIDVCAAPGGKALHAAERAAKVSARDLSDYKVKLIEENILRLDFTNIETKVWDATVLDSDMIGKADVVIADLPCSGLGVIGKKSDIKYKLTQKQQKELVELQRLILHTVKDYVKKGGVLIYSTCTVNQEENLDNRNWFLKHYDFRCDSLDPYLPDQLKSQTTAEGYLQLIQGVHETDGFFLSRFVRK